MMGGGEIIASFLDQGEIDEFRIHLIPILIGEGIPPHPASPPLQFTLTKEGPPQTPLLQSLPRRRRPPPLPHHDSVLNRVLYFSDGPFRDTSIGDHRDVFG